MNIERVKTGIKGLDEMLGGGFLRDTANLVEGAPGTGKTTLGMQFIYNGIVQADEPGLIISLLPSGRMRTIPPACAAESPCSYWAPE